MTLGNVTNCRSAISCSTVWTDCLWHLSTCSATRYSTSSSTASGDTGSTTVAYGSTTSSSSSAGEQRKSECTHISTGNSNLPSSHCAERSRWINVQLSSPSPSSPSQTSRTTRHQHSKRIRTTKTKFTKGSSSHSTSSRLSPSILPISKLLSRPTTI